MTYSVGREFVEPEGEFAEAYRLDPDGAVLVGPDGYVAWDSTDPTGLVEAVHAVLAAHQLAS